MNFPILKVLSPVLLISFLSISCIGKIQIKSNIVTLERKLQDSKRPHDSIIVPLLTSYVEFIDKYPDDFFTPIYLYRVGSIYYRMHKWDISRQHLDRVIVDYKNSDAYPEALLLAASSSENQPETEIKFAEKYYKTYLKEFPDGKGKTLAEFYFKPDDIKIRHKIGEYQNVLYANNENAALNNEIAGLLIRQYLKYSKKYLNSEFTPTYCFEGAKLASALGLSLDVTELCLTILEEYHDFKYYPETILLLAVEFEDKMAAAIQNYEEKDMLRAKSHSRIKRFDLKNTDWRKEAEKLYRTFIKNYPNHSMYEQAKAALKNIGKDSNSVVNAFRKNLEKKKNKINPKNVLNN